MGLKYRPAKEFYDLVVVGAGPGSGRGCLRGQRRDCGLLVIEPQAPGGQAGTTSKIENYLGFPAGITGADMGRRALIQATRFGAEFVTQRAGGAADRGQYRFVLLADGAGGFQPRRAAGAGRAIPAGWRFRAASSSPRAESTTALRWWRLRDAKMKRFIPWGGANSAGQAALHFAKYARRVTMLIRGEGLAATMSKYLIDEISSTPNIVLVPHTQVTEALGGDHLEGLAAQGAGGGESVVPASSPVCLYRGRSADGVAAKRHPADENGFLLAGPDLRVEGKQPPEWKETREPFLLESSVPGVFVAGDVRHGSVKRVAVGGGRRIDRGAVRAPVSGEFLECGLI